MVLVGSVEATILILFVVVVFGPHVAERLRVPGIVGLIFGGMLFGPFVIGWLEADGLVVDLGAIGILYLMFLAGLSFDIRAFQVNRRSAVTYGLLGFVIPFLLSGVVIVSISDIGALGAALIGAMWASNTLLAYPEVQSAGLQSNRAVSAAVSAGVVADLLSLTVLALATSTAAIDLDPIDIPLGDNITDLVGQFAPEPTTPDPTLPLWLGLPILVGFCLWLLPRISAWFFVRIGHTRTQRFVFALAGMAAGGAIALLGGIEGLVGAFLAGLGMNRLVPSKGPLMERLDFVGGSIFVPTFLVSVGLNIDPSLLVDRTTLVVGLLFTGFVLVGKTTAALITGRVFGLDLDEIGLMSSLSFGQAASTLAIAQVGLTLGMFDQVVVNAAVLAIVATALITSYGTRFFARRVPRATVDQRPIGEHVLLDVRPNGSETDSLAALAAALVADDDGIVVPYGITVPGELTGMRSLVDRTTEAVAARGLDTEGVVRIDESFVDGTLHLVTEHDASLVIASWEGPKFPADYLFGNDIDRFGLRSPVPALAVRVGRSWSRIVVGLGSVNSEWRRDDARLAFDVATRLQATEPLPLLVIARNPEDVDIVSGEHAGFDVATGSVRDGIRLLEPDDLVVVPAHTLQHLSPRDELLLSRAVQNVDLIVAGGPNRLSFTRLATASPIGSSLSATRIPFDSPPTPRAPDR